MSLDIGLLAYVASHCSTFALDQAEFEAIGRGMDIVQYVHARCAELRAAPNRHEYWRQLIAERTGQ